MIGLFRPKKFGKVFSYANQYVESSFLLFLIPLKSEFIDLNSKQIIEIPLNGVSLKNYYVSFALIASGIFSYVGMIAFGLAYSENENHMIYLPVIISGLLVLCGLFFSFTIGRSSKYEIKKRTIFQNVVGLNALPEWLSSEMAKSILEKCKQNLPEHWKERIANEEFSSADFFLYYTVLSYENRIHPTAETTILLSLLDKRIQK